MEYGRGRNMGVVGATCVVLRGALAQRRIDTVTQRQQVLAHLAQQEQTGEQSNQFQY